MSFSDWVSSRHIGRVGFCVWIFLILHLNKCSFPRVVAQPQCGLPRERQEFSHVRFNCQL